MGRHPYSAGDPILVVRRSHAWHWLPRPYRHITGGWACHWLRLHFLIEKPTDPADVEAFMRGDG